MKSFSAINFQRPILRAGVKKVNQQTRDELKGTLRTLESFLEKSEWFAGDELSLADIAFLANLGTVKVTCITNELFFFLTLQYYLAVPRGKLQGLPETEELVPSLLHPARLCRERRRRNGAGQTTDGTFGRTCVARNSVRGTK